MKMKTLNPFFLILGLTCSGLPSVWAAAFDPRPSTPVEVALGRDRNSFVTPWSLATGASNFSFFVSGLGNDSANGSVVTPWATLTNALARVTTPGSVIYLARGTNYIANAKVFSGVSIIGAGPNVSVLIYAGGTPAIAQYGLMVSNNVRIEGVSIYTTNGPSQADDQSQPILDISASTNVWVRNCYIQGWYDGFYASSGSGGQYFIEGNFFDGSFDTCFSGGAHTMYVWNNVFSVTNRSASSSSRGITVNSATRLYAWNNTFVIRNDVTNSVAYGVNLLNAGTVAYLGPNIFDVAATNPTVVVADVFVNGGQIVSRGGLLDPSRVKLAATGAPAKNVVYPFIGASGLSLTQTNVAVDYTNFPTGPHQINVDTGGSARNVMLDYSTNFPSVSDRVGSSLSSGGYTVRIFNRGANALNVFASGAETINGKGGITNTTQFTSYRLWVITNGVWGAEAYSVP